MATHPLIHSAPPFAGVPYFQKSSPYELFARISKAAAPILMQLPLTAAPTFYLVSVCHLITLLQTPSPTHYALVAVTVSSFAILFFSPPLLAPILLLQSFGIDLNSLIQKGKQGDVVEIFYHAGNLACSSLRLFVHRQYAIDLAILATAIRWVSDAVHAAKDARACFKGEDRTIELASDLCMLFLGAKRLSLQIEEKRCQVADSILQDLEEALQGKGPKRKYSEKQFQEIEKALARKGEKIRVVSYNILFDLFDDNLIGEAQKHSWQHRHQRVSRLIEKIDPDILSLQEAYPKQIETLQETFQGKLVPFVGEQKTGEINAIFYKPDRFNLDLQESSSFSLPLHPKDAWIGHSPGMLSKELEPGTSGTLATLFDRVSKQTISVINTHLTFRRINSREIQASHIADLAKSLQDKGRSVIITGDLNTFPNKPSQKMPFYDGTRVEKVLEKVLTDTEKASLLGHFGAEATGVTEFANVEDHRALAKQAMIGPKVTMDHIYASSDLTVLTHATDAARVGGYLPSDHLPTIVDLLMPWKKKS